MTNGQFQIDDVSFPIKEATFRYILDEKGWEFTVKAGTAEDMPDSHLLAHIEPHFSAEGDPIPLEDSEDLTGSKIYLESPFDDESGEPYFTLYVFEHGDLTHLNFHFAERDGDKYRMIVSAKIPAGSVLKAEAQLLIDTWINRLPNGSYS